MALYLTDRGEHTVLYKINDNVYIKTWKILNFAHSLSLSHTHTHICMGAQKDCNEVREDK